MQEQWPGWLLQGEMSASKKVVTYVEQPFKHLISMAIKGGDIFLQSSESVTPASALCDIPAQGTACQCCCCALLADRVSTAGCRVGGREVRHPPYTSHTYLGCAWGLCPLVHPFLCYWIGPFTSNNHLAIISKKNYHG